MEWFWYWQKFARWAIIGSWEPLVFLNKKMHQFLVKIKIFIISLMLLLWQQRWRCISKCSISRYFDLPCGKRINLAIHFCLIWFRQKGCWLSERVQTQSKYFEWRSSDCFTSGYLRLDFSFYHLNRTMAISSSIILSLLKCLPSLNETLILGTK